MVLTFQLDIERRFEIRVFLLLDGLPFKAYEPHLPGAMWF